MNSHVLNHPFSRSLQIHLFILLFGLFYLLYGPKLDLSPSEPITFEVVEPNPAKENGKAQNTIVRPSEGQLADQAKERAYLSDKTRVVDEQISARQNGDVSALGKQSTDQTKSAKSQTSKPAAQAKPISLSDMGVKISPNEKSSFQDQRNWAEQSTGESLRGGEYIQGMKQGEVSALNTKEFVFYSYFERVRKQLDQSWQPLLREQISRIYKNGRKLASNSDYVTRTLVTLTSKGDVARVQLLEDSGTMDLDDAAIQALNRAGPYPNPPKGLVDEQGEVKIRWDFILRT